MPGDHPRRFRVGGMMGLIALVGVCLGMIRDLPAVGVPMSAVLLPAALRTLSLTARRRAEGRPMVAGEAVAAFCDSLAVATGILFAGVVGLLGVGLAASLVLSFTAVGPYAGAIAVSVLALSGWVAAVYSACRRLWPYRDRPRTTSSPVGRDDRPSRWDPSWN